MRIRLVLLSILFGFSLNSFSQNDIDTFNIYKKETGIPFNIYMHKWFFGYGRNSYGYNPKKVNTQDSIVLDESEQKCFKIYKSKDRLLFCGCSGKYGSELTGNLTYYYRNGNVKRIEHWNNSEMMVEPCKIIVQINEAPGPEGTWSYFRRNGSVKKEIKYKVEKVSCEPFTYTFSKEEFRYSRDGKSKLKSRKLVYGFDGKDFYFK